MQGDPVLVVAEERPRWIGALGRRASWSPDADADTVGALARSLAAPGQPGVLVVGAERVKDRSALATLARETSWPVVVVGADDGGQDGPFATRLPASFMKVEAAIADSVLTLAAARCDNEADDLERIVRDALHELRTPLTVVLEYAGLLADGIGGELPDKARSFVDTIEAACHRMDGELCEFKELVRMRLGRWTFERDGAANWGALLPVLQDDALVEDASRDVLEEPTPAQATPADLAQSLLGLVAFARRASEERERPRLRLTRGPSGAVRVSIEYCGYPPSEHDRSLWSDRSTTAHGATATLAGTFGMGAALAERIVNRLGGGLRLEATETGGVLHVDWSPSAEVPIHATAARVLGAAAD